MPNMYLLPKEDGLPMRTSSGIHATQKLTYVEQYINIFSTAMKNQLWHSINYIDLFAGQGKCRLGKGCTAKVMLGSALLALTAKTPYTNYYFVELNEEFFSVLKQRYESSELAIRVHGYQEDCNIAVNDIVSKIQTADRKRPSNKWPSLNLAVLDPEGLELKWKTVIQLAKCSRMDLIIYYPEMALNREMKNQMSRESSLINDFFGTDEWRKIYIEHENGKPGIHRKLIDLYIGNLHKHGYITAFHQDEPLIRNSRRGPLYRLLFASKHERGFDFWKKTTQTDNRGQSRLPTF